MASNRIKPEAIVQKLRQFGMADRSPPRPYPTSPIRRMAGGFCPAAGHRQIVPPRELSSSASSSPPAIRFCNSS